MGDQKSFGVSCSKGKDIAVEEDFVALANLIEGSSVAVKVMVCRRWDVANSFGKYLSTDYLLSDFEGNSIQCSARNNISHRFVWYTVVKKLDCDVSCFNRFPFDLIPLEEVEVNDSTFLIDLIGCVFDMGKVRSIRGGAELVEFELVNERQSRVRFTLWAPLCHEIVKRKAAAVDLYIVILPGMNVKEFRGDLFVSNTSATAVYDAPDIPQISKMLSAFRLTNPTIGPIKPPPPAVIDCTVYELLLAGREQKETRRKSCIFHCKVNITDLRTKDGWFYFSCGIGGSKKRVSRAGTKFMCQACNKVCEFPRTSYRLHLIVSDHTGTVVLTIFDDIATRMIGKKAAQLLEDTDGDGDENVLPAPILALNNTAHTFEVKSHTYYDQGTYESFTVNDVIDGSNDKIYSLKRPRAKFDDGTLDSGSNAVSAGEPPLLSKDVVNTLRSAVESPLLSKDVVNTLRISHEVVDSLGILHEDVANNKEPLPKK